MIQLLLEGGAAGHMKHPFDLIDENSTTTGQDLVDIFFKTVDVLSSAVAESSLKIDGVNFTIRAVERQDGTIEIVRDGGTMKKLDLMGVGLDQLAERWQGKDGEEHGLSVIGKKVLTVMNDNIKSILPVLEKIGALSKEGELPCVLVNMEYVNGLTNTVDYSKMKSSEFLAVHGLLESQWEKNSKGKASRKTKTIKANDTLLTELAMVMDKAFKRAGVPLTVFGPQTSTLSKASAELVKKEMGIILTSQFSIKWFNGEHPETKPLIDWLEMIQKNPVATMSKTPYMNSLNDITISDSVSDPSDPSKMRGAADAILIYHTTRVLGKAILKYIDLPDAQRFGVPVISINGEQSHEGIVIKDERISPFPFKLTGDFLVDNVLKSKFRKDSGNEWFFFTGSFKPPHKGHFKTIFDNIAKVKGNGRLVVIIGSPSREENIRSKYIDAQAAARVFKLYCDKYSIPMNRVRIETIEDLKQDPEILEVLKTRLETPGVKPLSDAQLSSPITMMGIYINAYVEENSKIWIARGEKDANKAEDLFAFIKKARPDLISVVSIQNNVYMKDGTTAISATALRDAIDRYIDQEAPESKFEIAEEIKSMIPEKIKTNEFLDVLIKK